MLRFFDILSKKHSSNPNTHFGRFLLCKSVSRNNWIMYEFKKLSKFWLILLCKFTKLAMLWTRVIQSIWFYKSWKNLLFLNTIKHYYIKNERLKKFLIMITKNKTLLKLLITIPSDTTLSVIRRKWCTMFTTVSLERSSVKIGSFSSAFHVKKGSLRSCLYSP